MTPQDPTRGGRPPGTAAADPPARPRAAAEDPADRPDTTADDAAARPGGAAREAVARSDTTEAAGDAPPARDTAAGAAHDTAAGAARDTSTGGGRSRPEGTPRGGALFTVAAGSRAHRLLRAAVTAAAVAVAVGFPFNSEPVVNGQFTLMMVYAVAAVGLNLLIGYAGQISLGHGAFFAVGAYTVAILVVHLGIPHLLTVPAAALVTFLLGYAFGVPALRLHGLYLALVTLGLSIAVGPVIKRLDALTNGAQGMSVPQPEPPAWLPVDLDQYLYLLVLAVTAVMFGLAVNLTRGSLGRALVAIRGNERAAATMGVDRARVKTLVFAWSAAYAGVGGALFTFALGFVAPESFTLILSFNFLTAIVIGGLGTVGGALLGAAFIEFVPQYAGSVNQALTGVVYGITLILVMYVAPAGAAGLLRRLRERLVRVVEPPPSSPSPPAAPGGRAERPDGAAAPAGAAPPARRTDQPAR